MEYEAKTVVFRGTCGGGPTDEDNETGTVVQDSPPESIVLESVEKSNEILGRDEEIDGKNSDTDSERPEEQPENVTDPAPTDNEELMQNCKSLAASTSADLLQNVLRTSMCLEEAEKGNIKDAVSDV